MVPSLFIYIKLFPEGHTFFELFVYSRFTSLRNCLLAIFPVCRLSFLSAGSYFCCADAFQFDMIPFDHS